MKKKFLFTILIGVFLFCILSILLILLLSKNTFIINNILKPWKNYSNENCTFGDCESSDSFKVFNYWLEKAIEDKNPDLCKNVIELDFGDFTYNQELAEKHCRIKYAGRMSDFDYCKNLEEIELRNSCFRSIADNSYDIETCEKMPDTEDTYSIKYYCYSKVALKTKNADYCNLIDEDYSTELAGSKMNCLSEIAKVRKNTDICDNLSDPIQINECKNINVNDEDIDNTDNNDLTKNWEIYEDETDYIYIKALIPESFSGKTSAMYTTFSSDDGTITLYVSGECDGCTVIPQGPNEEFNQKYTTETQTLEIAGQSCSRTAYKLIENSLYELYEISCISQEEEVHIWGECKGDIETLNLCDEIAKHIEVTNN